jgi:hydrogenase maturation protease
MGERDRRVVLGIGNVLNRDEGLGVQALAALASRLAGRSDVELVDGGVRGIELLPLVESCSHLLVLDAVDGNRPPGAVIELGRNEIPTFSGVKLSEHQVTFQEVLGLASARNGLPPFLHLIGAQPADVSIGLGISATAAGAVPRICDRALAVLARWGLLP